MRTGDGGCADRPIGVISAVVMDESRPSHLLLGVRRPSPLAGRHPGVLSTPTLRLPDDLFSQLVAADSDLGPNPGIHPVSGTDLLVGRGGHVATIDGFALESLFARKLGLAGPLARGDFSAVARRRFLSFDDVSDPLGTGQNEWTAMLTYEIRVSIGVDTIPAETASYSRLVWVDAAKLPEAVAHRDALLLDETLDAAEVCVHGLCVRVASALLAGS